MCLRLSQTVRYENAKMTTLTYKIGTITPITINVCQFLMEMWQWHWQPKVVGWVSEWVEFNAPPDTIQVISEAEKVVGLAYRHVCITTNQRDTKSDPNPNPNHTQHAIVSIQVDIVICPTYPDKFIWDNVVAPFFYFLLSLSHCRSWASLTGD